MRNDDERRGDFGDRGDFGGRRLASTGLELGLGRHADLELLAELDRPPERRPDRLGQDGPQAPDSSSWRAAALVPPGDVTMFRSCAGCMPDCLANSVLPSSVSITRSWAMWRAKPRWTAASISASMTRNTYVGPVPETAVAIATSRSSSTSNCVPRAPSRVAACSRCSVGVSGVAYQTVMPLPELRGRVGHAPHDLAVAEMARQRAVVAPARIADHELARPQSTADLAPDAGQHLRLDAEQDDVRAFDRLGVGLDRPDAVGALEASRRSARGWQATIWSGSTRLPRSRPAMIASAMTPEPTVAIVRPASEDMGGGVCHARREFRSAPP